MFFAYYSGKSLAWPSMVWGLPLGMEVPGSASSHKQHRISKPHSPVWPLLERWPVRPPSVSHCTWRRLRGKQPGKGPKGDLWGCHCTTNSPPLLGSTFCISGFNVRKPNYIYEVQISVGTIMHYHTGGVYFEGRHWINLQNAIFPAREEFSSSIDS